MAENNNPKQTIASDDLTLLQAYPKYINQLIERLRKVREESIHYNAAIAKQKYAEVRNLYNELTIETDICEALQQELNQLQAEESATQLELSVRKQSQMALIESSMKRTAVYTSQYKDVLTKLECSCKFDTNSWALNLSINSDEVQQPNHLTLRYTQETEKFELIDMQPEPARLQEIRDFLDESNDVPGLLFMWRKSCMKRK